MSFKHLPSFCLPPSSQHQPQTLDRNTHTSQQQTLQPPTINMDSGRKDAGDKISDKMTPNNSKSTTDKIKEGITDTTDKLQR